MKPYTEKQFNIPELAGISRKNIEEHLKLYAGYVKNTNLILSKIEELRTDSEKNAYVIGELQRRLGFEFNGMRNHEHYFTAFENGAEAPNPQSALAQAIMSQFGSFDAWRAAFSLLSLSRGVGWAMLYWDHHTKQFIHAWIEEQHLGQLIGLTPILALDMWEHAYVYDYPTSEKKKYIEAFFANLHWSTIEAQFEKVL